MAPWMLGDGPDKIAVTWGLPIPPAWRVGKVFLKYELIRTQLKLRAAPDEVKLHAAPGIDIEEVNEFPEENWPLPEVDRNVNRDILEGVPLGDLQLDAEAEAAIVAFLMTLSDGFVGD